MSIECVYWGVFFDHDDLPEGELDIDIDNKHVTMGYRQPCPEDIVGCEVAVTVVGYGNDGANEGYEIELPYFMHEYWNNGEAIPHITLSKAYGASAKDTGYIDFIPMPDDEFEVIGYVGYFGFDEQVHFE